MTPGRLRVVGPGADDDVARTAEDWCARVAGLLGLAVPTGAVVELHAGPGVPWVEAGRVHLFQDPGGGPDLAHLPHELVHLLAGASPSRFLSEGLAVHADSRLGLGRPCWPCYRLSPDSWVVRLRTTGRLAPLTQLMEEARAVRLRRAGVSRQAVERAWRVYVTAGSFTGHLLARLRGRFWSGYATGACWEGAQELADLERSWLAGLPTELGPEDGARLAASVEDAGRDVAAGVAAGTLPGPAPSPR